MATTPPEFTGKTLAAWREAMGLSQRAAVEVIGCSRGALMKWESGESEVPLYIGLACNAVSNKLGPWAAPRGRANKQ